jgi:hypothetical protein
MKNLDLNAYGVTEMNNQEMENVDGGSLWSVIGVALCIIGVCTGNLLAVGIGVALGGLEAVSGGF